MKSLSIKIVLYIFSIFVFSCVSLDKNSRANGYYKVVVQNGDTLSALANKFDTTWQAIAKDNGIKDGRDIYVGQILYIKPGPGGLIASAKNERQNFLNYQFQDKSKKEGFLSKIFGLSNVKQDKLYAIKDSIQWPVRGEISSLYGYRWFRKHEGIDIKVPVGTRIKATYNGKVIFTGYKRGYGNTIIIDHGFFKSLYAHLNYIAINQNDYVTKGQYIGDSGNSGNSRGPHLHFELISADGTRKNPLAYLPKN